MTFLVRPFIWLTVSLAALWVGLLWSIRRHGGDTWAAATLVLAGSAYALFRSL